MNLKQITNGRLHPITGFITTNLVNHKNRDIDKERLRIIEQTPLR